MGTTWRRSCIHDAGLGPAELRWFDLDGLGDAMPVPRAGSSCRLALREHREESG